MAVWTVSNALVAGVFFAFSTFVMGAMNQTPPQSAAQTMQAINVVILRSPFIGLFVLSAVLSIAMPVWAWRSHDRAFVPLLLSGVLYLGGIVAVTAICNVPLNDRLAATAPPGLAAYWPQYLQAWLPWNHVRTLAGALSLLPLIYTRST